MLNPEPRAASDRSNEREPDVRDIVDYADRIGELWQEFLPTVRKMEQAKTKDEWPPTPNPLCAYCPYAECQYNTNPELRGAR